MTPTDTLSIGAVAYDAARRRYLGVVVTGKGARRRRVELSVPGHPGWGYRRIAGALAEAANRRREGEVRHAGA